MTDTRDTKAKVDTNRRALLGGLGLAAAGCPFSGLMTGQAQAKAPAPGHVTDAPILNIASPDDHVPFHGVHQAGIVTPRPAHGMVASFHVVAQTPDDLDDLLRRLTQRIAFLTEGGTPPELDPRLPPADSGIVGPVVQPDALTVTVALGASLFDDRPWLAPLKPARLSRMRAFPTTRSTRRCAMAT